MTRMKDSMSVMALVWIVFMVLFARNEFEGRQSRAEFTTGTHHENLG